MFVLLRITEGGSNFKSRLRDRFFAPEFELERIEMKKAAPFFVMTCRKYRGCVPYNTIAAASGKMKNKIVLPSGFETPENAPIKPFEGRKLRRQLLINTAHKILCGTQSVCSARRDLTLVDKFGAYTQRIEDFAECVEHLTVLTDVPERYERTAERLMERFGVSLIVRKGAYFGGEHGIVISDLSKNISPYFKGLLFTNDTVFPPCAHIVTGRGVDLGGYTDFEFPPEFDSVEIGEAMYELCYAGRLGDLGYKAVSFDGVWGTYEEISPLCLNSAAARCK